MFRRATKALAAVADIVDEILVGDPEEFEHLSGPVRQHEIDAITVIDGRSSRSAIGVADRFRRPHSSA